MVAMIAILASCNPEPPIVTITVVSPTDSVLEIQAGQTYDFEVKLSPDGTNKGEVEKVTILDAGVAFSDSTFNSTVDVTYKFSYKVADDAVEGAEINLVVEARDVSGEMSSETIAMKVGAPAISEILTEDVNYVFTTTGGNENMGIVFSETGISPSVGDDADLSYVWHGGTGNGIVSPNNPIIFHIVETLNPGGTTYDASTKKETKVAKYTGDIAFDDFTKESINELDITTDTWGYSTSVGNGVQPDVNDIIVFETEDGRKGAFLVTSFQYANKTDASLEGKVTFQKDVNSSATTK